VGTKEVGDNSRLSLVDVTLLFDLGDHLCKILREEDALVIEQMTLKRREKLPNRP
jgi:hypothetical protein